LKRLSRPSIPKPVTEPPVSLADGSRCIHQPKAASPASPVSIPLCPCRRFCIQCHDDLLYLRACGDARSVQTPESRLGILQALPCASPNTDATVTTMPSAHSSGWLTGKDQESQGLQGLQCQNASRRSSGRMDLEFGQPVSSSGQVGQAGQGPSTTTWVVYLFRQTRT
jgi:hypothetical protein